MLAAPPWLTHTTDGIKPKPKTVHGAAMRDNVDP